MVLSAEMIDSFLAVGKDCLLSPGFEGFDGFAFVRIWRGLLYFSFCIFFCCLFVFLFGLFLSSFYNICELLLTKIEKSAINTSPFLFDISFTVGVNRNSFHFHEHQSLSIEMNLFFCVIWIYINVPPVTLTKSSWRYSESKNNINIS